MAPNIVLDPTKWDNPTEEFIGVIRRCDYSDTDQSMTRDGQTFTQLYGAPRPLQTWEYAVERLDAVYKNKDSGETSPVTRFSTIQLERFDERQKKVVAVTQGDNKANYVILKWKDGKVPLTSPSDNVGLVCVWKLERTHRFGRGNPAKNLLYPVRVLGWMAAPERTKQDGTVLFAATPAPGAGKMPYELSGQVMEIEFDPAQSEGGQSLDDMAGEIDGANTGTPAPAGNSKSATSQPQFTEDEIVAFYVGKDPENEDLGTDIITEHGKARFPNALKTKVVTGDFLSEAVNGGKLVVADGVLNLP